MYLTGFADEAANDLAGQIRATRELGWQFIECRNIDGKNIHDLPEADFDRACEQLAAAGVRVNCFGSAIANWGKKITDPPDSSLAEARRAVPRMKRLGTKLVRIMSFAVLDGREADDQMEQERFARLRELVKMFGDEGLTPVHENCMNYGGMGWQFTMRMLENVPGLKLVFDTGNPVFSEDRAGPKPCPRQSAWEFYQHVKPHVAYVHIKDGVWDYVNSKHAFTHAGDGQGDVRAIVKDLLDSGFDGGISMEPHLAVVMHDPNVQSEAAVRYANYVEYGRRFMRLLSDVGHPCKS
jgi:sugar phosphate isomerase/epimerase